MVHLWYCPLAVTTLYGYSDAEALRAKQKVRSDHSFLKRHLSDPRSRKKKRKRQQQQQPGQRRGQQQQANAKLALESLDWRRHGVDLAAIDWRIVS